MAKTISKQCEYCGKWFETKDNCHERGKRFCNKSCSAKWRSIHFPHKLSEEHKQKLSK